MDLVWVITVIVGVVLVVILPLAVQVLPRLKRRKRPKLIMRAAEECGLAFQGEQHPFPREFYFALSGGLVKNVLRGSWKDGMLVIFDWEMEGSESLKRTVAAFHCEMIFPRFELQVATPYSKLGFYAEGLAFRVGLFEVARKRIVFDSNPEFSKNYLLTAFQDEPAIRAIFQPRLLQFLEQLDKRKKWRIKSYDSWLLVFSENPDFGARSKLSEMKLPEDMLLSPMDLRAFLEQSTRIAERFVEEAQQINS